MDELCAALKKLGHTVVLVGPRRTARIDFGADAGAVALLKKICPRALYELLELAYNILALLRLWWAVRKHRPDAIYERYNLFFVAGAWLRRFCKLPLLLEVNSPLFEERQREDGLGLPALAAWSERTAWRAADVVLPVTHVLADHIRRAGVPDERIAVIPNGIDPEKFLIRPDAAVAKRQLGLAGRPVLGFTGFVRSWNNLDRVLDILGKLGKEMDACLLLVGDGPAASDLRRRAAEFGISDRLRITGIVPRDQVAAHVAAFDIALQPGVTPYASPLKMLEYMAAGLAIVAPDQANIRELLRQRESALLVAPDNPKELEAAILELLRDEKLRASLGAAARATIDRRGLTWLANAEKLVGLVGHLWRAYPTRWRGRSVATLQP